VTCIKQAFLKVLSRYYYYYYYYLLF